jgi:hypothetical protein
LPKGFRIASKPHSKNGFADRGDSLKKSLCDLYDRQPRGHFLSAHIVFPYFFQRIIKHEAKVLIIKTISASRQSLTIDEADMARTLSLFHNQSIA